MKNKSGFTLIELLIVIAVIGVLAVGVLAALNITSQIGKANLAKAETFDASIQNSLSIDLVGEWTFNEGILGLAKDTSGYGNDGTVTGATLTTDRKGQSNKAYSFSSASIEFDTVLTGLASSTVSLWVAANDWTPTAEQFIFSSAYNNGSDDIRLSLNTNGSISITYDDGYQDGTNFLPSFIDGTWHKIAFTQSNATGTVILYLDGVEVNRKASGANFNYSSLINSTFIGRRSVGDAGFFAGKIDDVRIYKSALLSFQVQQLYAQGLIKRYLAYK